MRKVLLTCILVCISIYTIAQDQIIKDEFPTFQGVINASEKTSSEIYSNLKSWIATSFTSANDVIQLDDASSGKIIAKGISPFSYKVMGSNVGSKCYYTITLEAKDNRFRYTIDVTDVIVGTANQSAYKQLIEKPDNKQSKAILEEITKIKNEIISGLSQTNSKTDNNW